METLSATVGPVYRPRIPRQSPLHRCVRRHLPELEQADAFKRRIEKQVLERLAACGDLHCGFARVRCDGSGHEYLLAYSCKTRYQSSKAWLVDELAKAFDSPTVVVTHHLPATPSIASQYKDDVLNPAFASRLADVIEKYQPDLWIHGHTHVYFDYEIFGTRVVCNPRGYPSESTARGFSPGLVVEV